ncbi:MAG TPA: hypothetical protein VHD33_04820, partial [Legionellaceae bacterium]|nr:hypothetical protein [Legionellaceae bacterium]
AKAHYSRPYKEIKMVHQANYTFLLSQIFGSFIFIIAVILMSRMYYYRKIVLQIQPEDPIVPVMALLNLFIGVVLVVTHNIWALKHSLYITITCWAILIHGILGFSFPERILAFWKRIFSGSAYHWLIVILLVGGIIFLARGVQLYIMYRAGIVGTHP